MIHFSQFTFKPKKKYNFTEKQSRDLVLNKRYKPTILTGAQQEFTKIKPVKDFCRFGKGIIADTGINPDQAYIDFIRKDINKPFEQGKNPAYQISENDKRIALESGTFSDNEPDIPLRWSVGCTYKCPSPRLLPKLDTFKLYNFRPKKSLQISTEPNSTINVSKDIYKTENDIEKNEHYSLKTENDIEKNDNEIKKQTFLDTDHISIRVPSRRMRIKSEPKETYGAHAESKSFWIPKIHKKISAANRSGVDYNIINASPLPQNLLPPKVSILDNTKFHKLKGICEFSDYRNPANPNFNKRYQELLAKNPKIFYSVRGICAATYDNAQNSVFKPFAKGGRGESK